MTLYYSKSTGGFYDDAIHGKRIVLQQDPAWVRPQITLPAVEASTEQVIPDETAIPDANDPEWQRPTITIAACPAVPEMLIDDSTAEPVMIEVENPDCKIPGDAFEITAELHKQLLEDQAEGKLITCDTKGRLKAIERPALTKAEQLAIIDAERAEAYRRESDALGFKVLAGELEKSVWLEKRAEIKARFPK